MVKNKDIQNLGKVLNVSSETFMLVALVGLFALPFVVGSNLVASTREENNSPKITFSDEGASTVALNDLNQSDDYYVVEDSFEDDVFGDQGENSDSSAILGVSDLNEEALEEESGVEELVIVEDDSDFKEEAEERISPSLFEVVESSESLAYFDTFDSKVSDNKYVINLKTSQYLDNEQIFKVMNTSSEKIRFKFDVVANAKVYAGQSLLVDEQVYTIGSSDLPNYVAIQPGDELSFGLHNFSVEDMDISINIEVTKE